MQTEIQSGSVNLDLLHVQLPPPTRSPTSTRGLPSIGEGQPPFYSFTPFDGLRRQPLQNFLSSLYSSELGRKEEEELLAFTTILSSKNHRTRSRFQSVFCMLSVLNGWGIYRPQPNSKFELKTIKSIKSQNSGIRRLHLLTGEVAPPDKARRPSSGDATSLSGRLHRPVLLED